MTTTNIRLSAATNVGLVRQNNEDNFVINKDLSQSEWLIPSADEVVSLGEYGSLIVVADGMGGANAGEVASAIAIETVQEMFSVQSLENMVLSQKNIEEHLKTVIKTADINIYNHSKADESTHGMGTTIVICWIIGNEVHVAWCGDSRCYVFRNDSFMRVTKDHSFVQGLVDEGKITEEEAFDHPYSNVITRCLGSEGERAMPEVRTLTLNDGDIYLLCTDGLCGLCRDNEIMDVVMDNKEDLALCRDKLINAALEAGGHDNVTIALGKINVQETEQKEELESEADTPSSSDDAENSVSEEKKDDEVENDDSLKDTLPIKSTYAIRFFVILTVIITLICIIGYCNEYTEISAIIKQYFGTK